MDRKKRRFGIQAAATLIQNANLKGFFTGKIYEGATKSVCVPGLNYSFGDKRRIEDVRNKLNICKIV